jgi:hypothetical protein
VALGKAEQSASVKRIAQASIYPGAKPLGELRQYEDVSLGTYITEDDVNSVRQWYQERISRLAKPKLQGVSWRGDEGATISHDSDQPAIEGKAAIPRPVSVSSFTQSKPGYVMNVTVSRAKGESHTHIVISVMKSSVPAE